MKTFLQFINESTATQQAARLGLVGDGHGGWTDRNTGEFVAKTEKGKLKFYNKRQKVGGKDPEQSEKEKNLSEASLNCSSRELKSILRLSTRAGVPVFKRSVVNPNFCNSSVKPSDACSPARPALIDLFPIQIFPPRKVPVVSTTAFA